MLKYLFRYLLKLLTLAVVLVLKNKMTKGAILTSTFGWIKWEFSLSI